MKKILVVATLAVGFASCQKAGTGGDAQISYMVKHHDMHIPNATVYIKFNADEFPGDNISEYDLSDQSDSEGHGHFESLKKGKYYLYAVGYDSSVAQPVVGGVAIKIAKKDETVETTVPVTEGD
jgi:hypothetical protein